MRRLQSIVMVTFLSIAAVFADPINIPETRHLEGTVISITGKDKNYSKAPSLKKRSSFYANSENLKEGDSIKEKDWILSSPNTIAIILVEGVKVTLQPSTIIELSCAYERELRLREIWTLKKGEITVYFDSSKKKNPAVAFNTSEGYSVLITGTEFTLNEKGLASLTKGEIQFFERNYFNDNTIASVDASRSLGVLRPGQTGNGRMDPIELPKMHFDQPTVQPKVNFQPIGEPIDFPPLRGGDRKEPGREPPTDQRPMALPPDRKDMPIVESNVK